MHSPIEDNIPTLTDAISSASSDKKEKLSKPEGKEEVTRTSDMFAVGIELPSREQLEAVIHEKLTQKLPLLCQELADEIIAELENSAGKNPHPKSDKKKTRR